MVMRCTKIDTLTCSLVLFSCEQIGQFSSRNDKRVRSHRGPIAIPVPPALRSVSRRRGGRCDGQHAVLQRERLADQIRHCAVSHWARHELLWTGCVRQRSVGSSVFYTEFNNNNIKCNWNKSSFSTVAYGTGGTCPPPALLQIAGHGGRAPWVEEQQTRNHHHHHHHHIYLPTCNKDQQNKYSKIP